MLSNHQFKQLAQDVDSLLQAHLVPALHTVTELVEMRYGRTAHAGIQYMALRLLMIGMAIIGEEGEAHLNKGIQLAKDGLQTTSSRK